MGLENLWMLLFWFTPCSSMMKSHGVYSLYYVIMQDDFKSHGYILVRVSLAP